LAGLLLQEAAVMLEAAMTAPDKPEQKPRGLRAIYAWMLANARGRHAWAAVAVFAFAEASFFPIPADIMVLPMMIADRERVFRLGAWVAFWSVMGGVLGYVIGHLFWETAGLWLVHALHLPLAQVEALRAKYTHNAYFIMVQGATPIPYKLVTIASGLAGVAFPLFMLYSAVTRSIRYLVIEALLVHFFGEKAQELLEKYLELALILFLIVLVLGFVALKFL
jgi:membrane protein YqaA with SNARE-associated domain